MKKRRWAIGGVLGAVGWIALGWGGAQAGTILPTDPTTKLTVPSSPVTVSLYQLDSDLPSAITLQSPSRCITTRTTFYRDVTDCWLPEWKPTGGKSIFVVVNGSTNVPSLVPHAAVPALPLSPTAANPFVAALTTSAYPGQCTNVGSGTEDDFTLNSTQETLATSPTTSVVGYKLTPNDCGGMAVIQVGGLKFILPKDGAPTVPANGIPDAWENLYGGALNPATDVDIGPIGTSLCCDGIATFDEYRGFIVSGNQIRTDPTQRDLSLRLMNPVCPGTSTSTSLLGGGTTTYPTPTSLGATLTLPATAVTAGSIGTFTASAGVFSNAHTLGEIIGISGGSVVGRATIIAVTNSTSVSAQITQAFSTTPTSWQLRESVFATVFSLLAPNQVHLLAYIPGGTNSASNTEWLDTFVSLTPSTSGPATLSVADSTLDRTINPNRLYGPPQKGLRVMECQDSASPASLLGWAYGVGSPNAVGNVILYTQTILNYITGLASSATTLKYSTASFVNAAWTWSTPMVVDLNFIVSRAIQFYTAMEVVHSLSLTPGVQGTNKTSYGHHWAPGTGDCVDQTITTTSKSGTVTFYIPSLCGTADQGTFVLQ